MTTPSQPPRDPRLDRDVPAFGTMPVVERLDELTVRVLAPNPSPMTLDGTNTYVLARPGSGAAVVLDPGPDDPEHRARVDAVLADGDLGVEVVLVTHHHLDHAAAAAAWAADLGATVVASTRGVAGDGGRVLADGGTVEVGGLSLRAVATPGHCADHLAFRSGGGALLTGDHVLGRGTSVVAWPDGDLAAYLESLRRVLGLGPDALYPGHGPEMADDPSAVVRYYLEHRAFRERQILAVLEERPATPREIVEVVYVDVDRRLWPAAEASTRAAIAKLSGDGRVRSDGDLVTLV